MSIKIGKISLENNVKKSFQYIKRDEFIKISKMFKLK